MTDARGEVGKMAKVTALAVKRLDKLARFFRNSPDMKPNIPPVLITFALVCFTIVQNTQAVSPPPDGGYPGGNTAEGDSALGGLTSGFYNSAVGFLSLLSNGSASFNTGVGAGTLLSNTANENTATGAGALFSNTSGGANTATGAFALFGNTAGSLNTATGFSALQNNTTGDDNTANGAEALANNTIGGLNTAVGFFALSANTNGNRNTAIGYTALEVNSASDNTAVGAYALGLNHNDGNTAVGSGALITNLSGSLNTALGQNAGQALDGGESNNIDIGANVDGVAGESNTIRIGNTDIMDTFISGISGTTVASGAAVLVDSNGHLGTVTSSKRFKEEIRPMNRTSEAIFSLEPVTFRYKPELDPEGIPQFGLVAEEVEKVNSALVARDADGKPYTVRYEAVNAMLLNEFLKAHQKMEEQGATIARQQKQIEALTAGLQKVSAELETSRCAPQMVGNDQ